MLFNLYLRDELTSSAMNSFYFDKFVILIATCTLFFYWMLRSRESSEQHHIKASSRYKCLAISRIWQAQLPSSKWVLPLVMSLGKRYITYQRPQKSYQFIYTK